MKLTPLILKSRDSTPLELMSRDLTTCSNARCKLNTQILLDKAVVRTLRNNNKISLLEGIDPVKKITIKLYLQLNTIKY